MTQSKTRTPCQQANEETLQCLGKESAMVNLSVGSLNSNDSKAMKTSLENTHLRSGDYFVIIASSSHP